MKFLVLLLVLGVAYMVWRGQRLAARKEPDKPGRGRAVPQDMVACARCGVHVPHGDAWVSGEHTYCSAEHQQQDGR